MATELMMFRNGLTESVTAKTSPLTWLRPLVASLQSLQAFSEGNAGTDTEETCIHNETCNSCEEVYLPSHLILCIAPDTRATLLDYRRRQVPMSELPFQI